MYAAGRLTRQEALVLIESLYLLLNEFIPDGWLSRDGRGQDASGKD